MSEERVEYQVTGGYYPPEAQPVCSYNELAVENRRLEQYLERKLRASNTSLADGHRRMQLELRSLQDENASLREQVTQSQAIAHKLNLELAKLRVLLREFGVEL